MNYKVEILGGLTRVKTILEGTLSENHTTLKKAILSEKRLMNINPTETYGYTYYIDIDNGRGKKNKKEFLFNDSTLPKHFKELLQIAEVEASVFS